VTVPGALQNPIAALRLVNETDPVPGPAATEVCRILDLGSSSSCYNAKRATTTLGRAASAISPPIGKLVHQPVLVPYLGVD